MRPTGSAQVLEQRRLHAFRLLREGKGPAEVGRSLGVTRRSVQRWAGQARRMGKEGLKAKPHAGRPSRLKPHQRQALARALIKGPRANGFPADTWSCRRVAELLERRYGVRYHEVHVGRILRSLGWKPQRPERRAFIRGEGGAVLKPERRAYVRRPLPQERRAYAREGLQHGPERRAFVRAPGTTRRRPKSSS